MLLQETQSLPPEQPWKMERRAAKRYSVRLVRRLLYFDLHELMKIVRECYYGGKQKLSPFEMYAQFGTFLLAGEDTVSSHLSSFICKLHFIPIDSKCDWMGPLGAL